MGADRGVEESQRLGPRVDGSDLLCPMGARHPRGSGGEGGRSSDVLGAFDDGNPQTCDRSEVRR
ncbi:hypothetical protein BKA07_002108 [Brevibacterium marinum]|uniref:Uncharacterized protein n=1 Tax=Brevibacterium marinum TaxID=418643 RepID=A0A846S280_9MICO|nr:hypothetical protein [Brevibacterium marinum]NJC57073.1 hypothetical protein [Brevibacterium marinum]